MHCPSCALLIDGDLEETEGIIEAKTNYARRVCAVCFDDRKINLDKIITTIKNSGYEASPL